MRLKKMINKLLFTLALLAVTYLLLLVPDSAGSRNYGAPSINPFIWHQDELWTKLENDFRKAKQMPQHYRDSVIAYFQNDISSRLQLLEDSNLQYDDRRFFDLEDDFFHASAYVAATNNPGWYLQSANMLRAYIKKQSQQWNVKDTAVKNALYKLLYGIRAATEEVLLQTGVNYDAAPAVTVQEERSSGPYTTIFGVKVYSGDLLVSRGGAEVSALISRGNDYPGNFSHVALLFIDAGSKMPYLIEAHIEKGVAVSTVEQYIKDKKLRFMVLRLRHDLPVMKQDSTLPQKAAQLMFNETSVRHIPYDFKMNFGDSAEMFCSEVASYAYRKRGVQLWQNMSTISSTGVVNWLRDFGVENFVTQMPSDLEYDPQLTIVAEWRDPETLYKDHIDNAAMDALLEKANGGTSIGYNKWMLPVARVIKGWCVIKNLFGKPGTIPEGMSATSALKNQTFVAMHQAVTAATAQMAGEFVKQNGYRAPYWQLVKFANAATNNFFKEK